MPETSGSIAALTQDATSSLAAVDDWMRQQHWSTHNLPTEVDVEAVSPVISPSSLTRRGLNNPRVGEEAAGAGRSHIVRLAAHAQRPRAH